MSGDSYPRSREAAVAAGCGVSGGFVRPVIAAGAASGVDVRRALGEARLPVDPGRWNAPRVPWEQAVSLVRVMWHRTGDELLGLGPRPVPLGTVRMISPAVIHAPDLGTALGPPPADPLVGRPAGWPRGD
ncbi:AraC family transcriptional regulator ligand-binding domain-containing protein [Streptomyces sp. NPDC095613]|uniref:AraC family transcriptional regulator ligand-binding domain-containing protein n=1 Tax=Streptomyces sp. NPDC095613 TaxID=3155540 RepID=UPI00332C0C34